MLPCGLERLIQTYHDGVKWDTADNWKDLCHYELMKKMCTLTQLHETSSGLLFEWWIGLVTFVSNLHFQLMIFHRGVPGFETACHCGVLVPLVDYAVAHLARVPCLICSRTKEAYRQGNSLLPPAWWSIFRNKVLNDSCAFCRIESVFLLMYNFTFFSLFYISNSFFFVPSAFYFHILITMTA